MKDMIKNFVNPIYNNKKGFTLIELAIVMVIIGLILGAVMKGQDLIQGARAKKFVVDTAKKWETATWTYFDRKGRFPGDADLDGVIGDSDAAAEFGLTTMSGAPTASLLTLGSFSFYTFLGNDGAASAKNLIFICPASNCTTAFTTDEMLFVEALDLAIDGKLDGLTGQIRCDAGLTVTPNTTTFIAAPTAAIGAPTTCVAGTTEVIIYYFDRAP